MNVDEEQGETLSVIFSSVAHSGQNTARISSIKRVVDVEIFLFLLGGRSHTRIETAEHWTKDPEHLI